MGTILLNGAKAKYGNLSLKCMVQNQKALNFYSSQGFEIVSQVDDELGGYYYMSFGTQT
ncbi:TPA: acetyltransferase [Vibrio cholerae]|nr:acetyltransferase [Vibrio cholerae]